MEEHIGNLGVLKTIRIQNDSITFSIFNSIFFRKLSGYTPQIKDNSAFEFYYSKPLNQSIRFYQSSEAVLYRNRTETKFPQLGVSSMIPTFRSYETDYFSNQQTTFIQQRGQFLLGFQTEVIQHSLKTGAGFSYDEDNKNVGKGLMFVTNIHSSSYQRGAWQTTYETDYEHQWIRPRENSKGMIQFQFNWSEPNQNSFAMIDTRIQRYERDIPTTLPYKRSEWNGNTTLRVSTPALFRGTFDAISEIDGFRIRQGVELPSTSQLKHLHNFSWTISNSNPFFSIEYDIGSQSTRFGDIHLNQQSERVGLFVGINSTHIDTIQFSFESMVSKVTTPDTSEYSDRDEFTWKGGILFTKQFLPNFLLRSRFQIADNHPVYLSKYTSFSNRTIKNYLFESAFEHLVPNQLFHQFKLEFISTYILYDFSSPDQESRDLVSRRFTFFDSLVYQLEYVDLILRTNHDIEDRGIYYRSTHEMSLAEAFHTFTGTVQCKFNYRKIPIYVGMTGYMRKPIRYRNTIARNVLNNSIQPLQGIGPIVEFRRTITNQWGLSGKGSYLILKQVGKRKETQTDIQLVLSKQW